MIHAPGQIFKSYAHDMIQLELTRPEHRRCPLNVLERRLWDAAAFDSYIVGQNSKPLLDDLGIPRDEAMGYASVIKAALKEFKAGRDS